MPLPTYLRYTPPPPFRTLSEHPWGLQLAGVLLNGVGLLRPLQAAQHKTELEAVKREAQDPGQDAEMCLLRDENARTKVWHLKAPHTGMECGSIMAGGELGPGIRTWGQRKEGRRWGGACTAAPKLEPDKKPHSAWLAAQQLQCQHLVERSAACLCAAGAAAEPGC